MNNRISTGMMFSQSLASMMLRQKQLTTLQQQLASGQKLVTAKDDPVAAGTAVGLDRALAELERFGKNAITVANRLGLQENLLAQAGDSMGRVNDLVVQANNSSLSDDDRRAIAAELRSIHDGLLSLANSTDGSGRYLFGGSADDSAPFSKTAGGIVYNGDQTQRRVEIAPETFVADATPGSEIFMRIRTGDGTVDAHADIGNAGTVVLTDYGRASGGGWNGDAYRIVFTGADTYEVLDDGGNTVGGGTWASGEDIAHGGLRLRLEGEPAIGDAFEIGAAGHRDVFATLRSLIGTLEGDALTVAEKAARQNALQGAMRDVARASEQMIDARAAGGAQLAAIDDAASVREANAVTIEETLSGLRDLDYADALTRYQMESTALQTAQTVFARMQGMSLFDLLR
ncbi:flagellar hook-associated protein 3 [Pseudoxanthomonas broegbernensis]|uniref:Flagellar hook-associated protein 3 n=1 Tax=Pseudoxanthomonas broegbernensis TaxID=83619 RepID=A0A7V8GL58_9GAMM|nr:flagellar hook-associated protein FlgL [Pseudoxanthomonas broegbernensis]KAF1685588.1 flagellar hook-associated protein 3 [Pseudoxanthomonas broegbernensis]MBB6065960.1 flagellar hook-associated protein 3 FlgL [Pseudoxanthomonas broegbernensis]